MLVHSNETGRTWVFRVRNHWLNRQGSISESIGPHTNCGDRILVGNSWRSVRSQRCTESSSGHDPVEVHTPVADVTCANISCDAQLIIRFPQVRSPTVVLQPHVTHNRTLKQRAVTHVSDERSDAYICTLLKLHGNSTRRLTKQHNLVLIHTYSRGLF